MNSSIKVGNKQVFMMLTSGLDTSPRHYLEPMYRLDIRVSKKNHKFIIGHDEKLTKRKIIAALRALADAVESG